MGNVVNTDKIKNYIKNTNLSQASFCKLCGIGTSTLQRIYAGRDCSLISLFKIAKTMGIPIHELFE